MPVIERGPTAPLIPPPAVIRDALAKAETEAAMYRKLLRLSLAREEELERQEKTRHAEEVAGVR